jgi:hypothetical protein
MGMQGFDQNPGQQCVLQESIIDEEPSSTSLRLFLILTILCPGFVPLNSTSRNNFLHADYPNVHGVQEYQYLLFEMAQSMLSQ